MLALLLGAAVFALLAAGTFAPLEAWFPRSDTRPRRRAIALCAALLLVNTACMRLVGHPVLASITEATGDGAIAASLAPWLRVALAFVLGDLLGYALHRALHEVPWLWRFHRVHHADVPLHFWEGWRLHPVDFVAHGLAVGVPGVVLGAPFAELVWLVLLRRAYTAYLHANLPWRHGALAGLIASPSWHAVHHDADRRGDHANFAAMFPWIDRLFGTHRVATAQRAAASLDSPLSIATTSSPSSPNPISSPTPLRSTAPTPSCPTSTNPYGYSLTHAPRARV
jgi:sterol desaturase/sphingolipid hydroxylase (fatty acid hydroxylase superfamily)